MLMTTYAIPFPENRQRHSDQYTTPLAQKMIKTALHIECGIDQEFIENHISITAPYNVQEEAVDVTIHRDSYFEATNLHGEKITIQPGSSIINRSRRVSQEQQKKLFKKE